MLKRLATLCLTVLLFLSGIAWSKDAQVIAKVGPYSLTKADFEKELEKNSRLKALLAMRPELKQVLVKRWVEVTLLALAGEDEGLLKDPEVKAQIEEQTRMILAQNYYERKVLKNLKVSERELQEYYLKHKKDYRVPERVKARHILIRVPEKAGPEAQKAALKKAEDLRQKILAGADFSEIARKYSEDPGTKDKGGDLGFFARGQMIPEFEEAVFKLKVGEISPPIKTRFGYHLVQVEAKVPAQEQPYEKVKDQVRQDLLEAKKTERIKALMTKLSKKYPVEIYTENLP
ncbi:peptidylprolyl isomerase [Thermosulfurimonas dismutans]|uniref:peptidylprolyl isomerase n=1 Tax=Thermosulfurimonas dismutans TaxID=999894 RepID=A0A179D7G3_9BACT|nr:peptidylprolyl isomerase [Thermosulfurimonas dismutans]OAQ21721.1 Peptidyl-prolyl cis-trans isomerase PpiD [Thermosulfurimonas dismutans]